MTVTEQIGADSHTTPQTPETDQDAALLRYEIVREWEGTREAKNGVTYKTHMIEVRCDPACGGQKELDKSRWNGIKYVFCPTCKSRWYYGDEHLIVPSMRLVELRMAQGLATEQRAWDAPKEDAVVSPALPKPPSVRKLPADEAEPTAKPEYYLVRDSIRRVSKGVTYLDIKCANCTTIIKNVLSAAWSPRRDRAFACPGCGAALHFRPIDSMEVRPRGTYKQEVESPLQRREKPVSDERETEMPSVAAASATEMEQEATDRAALEQAFAPDTPAEVQGEEQVEPIGIVEVLEVDLSSLLDVTRAIETTQLDEATAPDHPPESVLTKIARGDYAVRVAPELISDSTYALLDTGSQQLIDQVRARLSGQDRERWEAFWLDALRTYHFLNEDEQQLRAFANKYASYLPMRDGTVEDRMQSICEVLSDLQRLLQV